jgi:hypothetical protein
MNATEWMMPPETFETAPVQSSARRRFLLFAGLSLLIYALLWVLYTVPALGENRPLREVFLWIAIATLLTSYAASYQALKSGEVPALWVVGSGAVLAVMALMIPPFHSTDVFGYINRGWQQLQYGMNPYIHTVDHIPGWEQDPMITDHWVNNPSPYGFLYLLVAKTLTAIGGGSKAATVMVFKSFNLLAHLATAAIIWLGVRRLQPDTGQGPAWRAVYLYAWNPLMLIHSLSNGHNDILMGFLVTTGAFFAIIGSWLWILPALVGATLIKYGALVIIPFALLFLFKQRAWAALFGGLMLGALVFFGTGAPFLGDWRQFHFKQIERNAFVSHGSLHSVVYSLYKTIGKELFYPMYEAKELARSVLKNLLLGIYAIFYGWLAITRWRQPIYKLQDWLMDALLVMAVMVCLISLKFYPWYLGMFFPLAFFLEEGHWLRRFMIVLSGTQMLALTFIGQSHFINFALMTGLALAWLIYDLRRPAQKAPASTELRAVS